MSANPRTHLYRSARSTWCGRKAKALPFVTHNAAEASCIVCLNADYAEQRKEDAATKGEG